MKKCKGCGIELQDTDKDKVGYVVSLEQNYCQRCFRLSHYGDTSHLKTSYVTNDKIFDIYSKYSNELFVVIIDILEALVLKDDELFETFKGYNTLIIINKTDLLPENMNNKKINDIYSKILFDLNKKYKNIRACILTNKFENQFNEQFLDLLDELKVKRAVFAGRANSGKSSLINKLINNKELTTSLYPGTTLDEVIINYKDYTFIDTPGLVDINNYSTHLNSEKYKLSKIDKTIKPQVFQFYEQQSYFYEGLLRIDVKPIENSSITFYINNDNEIHRTKAENADDYYQKHYYEFRLKVKPLSIKEYHIENSMLFVIKGLGMIKVNGNCDIMIHSLADCKVYISEVSI